MYRPKDITHEELPPEFWVISLGYWLVAVCFIAPPNEFVSAGLTVQNLLSGYLGSEELNFIYYHMKRTQVTLLIHSVIPLLYYIILGWSVPGLHLFTLHLTSKPWLVYLLGSLLINGTCCLLVFYWSSQKHNNHPIAKMLGYHGNGNSWRAVASSINIEFRRITKFTSGIPGRRLYVTDSWIIQTSTYCLYIAHQGDIHLTLSGQEQHEISHENFVGVQYLNITVCSVNEHVKPFTIRLNSLEYGDLREKLQAPVRNARNIVIQQSLSDRFIHAFKEQVGSNPYYRLPPHTEVDQCIGCMGTQANVKLQKHCDNISSGDCVQCYCRPLWCIDCMGKWFASRQDQSRPDTWMSSKAPCPMCRATFCVLDVCKLS